MPQHCCLHYLRRGNQSDLDGKSMLAEGRVGDESLVISPEIVYLNNCMVKPFKTTTAQE